MSFIRVGINENVRLKGAEINDRESLQVSFVSGQAAGNIDDLLNSTAGVSDNNGVNIILWPAKTEYNGTPREAKDVARDLTTLRDQLEQILGAYMTTENAKLDPYAGLDTSNVQAFQASLTKQATVDRIYKNLASQFVAKVNTLTDEQKAFTFRLKLVRTSANNHYGTLPRGFVRDNPFWESMSIPAAASKVKFTKYEISKGMDNPTAIDKDAVADTQKPADVPSATDAILGLGR